MKRQTGQNLIVLVFFLLTCVLFYVNPRLDWRSIMFLGLLFALQALCLYGWEQKSKREEQKQIASLLHLLQDIEQHEEVIDLQDSPLGVLRDEIRKSLVEKRENKERAVRARQLLKKNVEDLTHQIKTPLTGILLLLDLMKEDPERQDEYLALVQTDLERLYRLSDLLLKLSSLDAEMVTMKQESLSALSLISDAEAGLAAFLAHKQVALQIESEDIEIRGDRTWLLEAISNILKNAIEASPDNSRIEIRFVENQIYQSIFVRDHGSGIPKEQAARIFERFYKADPNSSGFGIGLPLVKSIMEAHGGTVNVESDPQGTVFELRFYLDGPA